MPNRSKVWINQSDRNLTDLEIAEIKRNRRCFYWNGHSRNMMVATIDVLYHRFIVVLVDEDAASASGCGIDKSVRFISNWKKIISSIYLIECSLLSATKMELYAGQNCRSSNNWWKKEF